MIECRTPAPSHTDIDTQEVDWPYAIPVEIPPQYDQQNEQSISTEPTHQNLGPAEIPQPKDNSEGEQYQDLETYLSHHNMFEASQHIHRDYRSRLLVLDDDKYYQEVDRVFDTYGTPPVQDYRPANQAPSPYQTTARSFCSQLGGVVCVSVLWFLLFLLQLCQRSLLLWLCINVLRLLGNVVRAYPRIVQGLTFLSA